MANLAFFVTTSGRIRHAKCAPESVYPKLGPVKERYEEMGSRLSGKRLQGVGAKGDFWRDFGYFTLEFQGSGAARKLVKIKYIGGAEAPVSPECQNDGWELQSNWMFKEAVITKGVMSIKCATFVEKSKTKLEPPLKLTEVLEPSHTPLTPAGSTASSTPKPRRYGLSPAQESSPAPPPPGDGGALETGAS